MAEMTNGDQNFNEEKVKQLIGKKINNMKFRADGVNKIKEDSSKISSSPILDKSETEPDNDTVEAKTMTD